MSFATRLRAPLMRHIASASVILAFAAPAAAQDDVADTYILLTTFAAKGLECDLLRPWEAATIRAETERFLTRYATADAEAIRAAAGESIAETPCDDEGMNQWLDAALPGVETEWLPPNLAMFRGLAAMEPRLPQFEDAATGMDVEAAIAEIEAQFAAFTAEGIEPEGDPGWETFQQSIDLIAVELADAIVNGDNDTFMQAEAETILIEATEIARLWLADREMADE